MLIIERGAEFQYGKNAYRPDWITKRFVCAECHATLRRTLGEGGCDVFFCSTNALHDGVVSKAAVEAEAQDRLLYEKERQGQKRRSLLAQAKRYSDVEQAVEDQRKREASLLWPKEEEEL